MCLGAAKGLTIDEALDSSLAGSDSWGRRCSMPQPLHKSAMSEASARYVSIKAFFRVQELGFFAILEYAVTVHLQMQLPRLQVSLFCNFCLVAKDAEHKYGVTIDVFSSGICV